MFRVTQFVSYRLVITVLAAFSGLMLMGDRAAPGLSQPPLPQPTAIRTQATHPYLIFGDGEFETTVEGYLVIREEKVWDKTLTLAYLRVTQFQDAQFKEAIAQGIEQQNRVNQIRDQSYELGLGCYDKGKLKGIQHDPKLPYLTPETQQKLLDSRSSGQAISLRLIFGKHVGSDCECCNLMHAIRLSS